MTATIMVALDGTIANVALPHMQSAMLASTDQIVWVLTSYFIAAAISIPLCGWLAERFGRKPVMVISVAGFTLASLACGMATSLEEMVLFRLIQGACGASLVPLSQAVMLDINPPERQAQAMALYGMGSILGPVIGPTLGGWLTESMGWRWIFLINLPIGVISLLILITFLNRRHDDQSHPFDMTGFALLSLFVVAFQLMLDRGQQLDWFDSTEIKIEATLAGLFGVLAMVHMFTVRNPFLKPALLTDRNFLIGIVITAAHSMLIFAVSALLAPMLQRLLGYSVMLTGMVTAPRGIGTMIAMFLCGQIINRIDARLIMATGMVLSSMSMGLMAHFSLMIDTWTILWVGLFQGFGAGLVFVPLTTMMFATIDPRLRNECASLISLVRNLAAAGGIAALQALTIRNTATVQSRLVEGIRPDNPMIAVRDPGADFSLPGWIAGMDLQIIREATMVAYLDSFWLLCWIIGAAAPLGFLMLRTKNAKSAALPVEH